MRAGKLSSYSWVASPQKMGSSYVGGQGFGQLLGYIGLVVDDSPDQPLVFPGSDGGTGGGWDLSGTGGISLDRWI